MANTIRIKRSVSTNTPASLLQGELAYSESGSPNGVGELFIGTAGPSVTKICTEGAEVNQTITTGVGIDGADAGSSGDITLTFAPSELGDAVPVAADKIVFQDISDGPGLGHTVAFSAVPLSLFNNDLGTEANQTITTGLGIDGADAGDNGDITISLAFTEVGVTAATAADWIMFDDAGVTSKFLISGFNVGLFDNSTAEYVSENDTIVVNDWNWVLDEDTLVSNSAVHVPTQQSVKAYVDTAVTSSLQYQGGYNAATNVPDLDTSPSGISVGDVYTVTTAGTFFTETVEAGDMLIAEVDNPTLLADWTVVQSNIGAASESAPGYIEIATQAETDGTTDDARAITSLKLHNTTFDGGTF